MSTNEPLTEKNDSRKAVASDTSSTASKPPLYIGSEHEYVYSIFRQDGTPIRKMIWTAVVMQLLLIPIVCIMPYPWAGTAKIVFGPQADSFAKALKELPPNLYIPFALASPVSFIALLAIPYVPGIILRRHFRDAVIPMCRNTCPGKDIFRGAMRSLRYMLACYVPVLLPGILVYLVPVVFTLGFFIKLFCDAQGGELVIIHGSFSVIVWMYLLSLPGWILSEYALAIFPVARLFTRLSGVIRPGMFLILPLIYLGRIVFILNPVFTAEKTAFLTVAVIVVCTAVSVGAIAFFNHAARTDAEKWERKD